MSEIETTKEMIEETEIIEESKDEAIRLKGIKDGIMVIVGEAEFEDVLSQTIEKIKEVTGLVPSDGGRVLFTGNIIDAANKIKLEQELRNLLSEDTEISYEDEDTSFFEKIIGSKEKSKFYYGTIRSGQSIRSLGNLVVVGDVNPGAELIAEGNIVVVGILRGIVHAGCNGDKDATVTAARMSPTQIRIADIITRPPDGDTNTEWFPEIAYAHEGNIYIDGYLSKKFK